MCDTVKSYVVFIYSRVIYNYIVCDLKHFVKESKTMIIITMTIFMHRKHAFVQNRGVLNIQKTLSHFTSNNSKFFIFIFIFN